MAAAVPMLIGSAVGAIGGAIKQNQKKGEYNRQKELAAKTTELSPWTGMKGEMPQNDPNAFDSIMSGTVGGGMMGQNVGSMLGSKSEGVLAGATSGAPMAGGAEDSPWAQLQKKQQGMGQGYGTMMS
jgi:uncharacterized membrane protein